MENAPIDSDAVTKEMVLDALRQIGFSEDRLEWALQHIPREYWPNFIQTDIDKRLDEIAQEYPDVPPPYNF